MKNKSIKILLASIFAFSLGLTLTTVSKANKAESVAALSLEEEVPTIDSGDDSSTTSEEETPTTTEEESPTTTEEETPALTEETSTDDEESPTTTNSSSSSNNNDSSTQSFPRKIIEALKNTLRDSWDAFKQFMRDLFHRN